MKPSETWERFPYKVFDRYILNVSDCALVLDWTSSHTETHTDAQKSLASKPYGPLAIAKYAMEKQFDINHHCGPQSVFVFVFPIGDT